MLCWQSKLGALLAAGFDLPTPGRLRMRAASPHSWHTALPPLQERQEALAAAMGQPAWGKGCPAAGGAVRRPAAAALHLVALHPPSQPRRLAAGTAALACMLCSLPAYVCHCYSILL